jgi:hypothetical protein
MSQLPITQDRLKHPQSTEPMRTTLVHAVKLTLLITGYILLSVVVLSLYHGG